MVTSVCSRGGEVYMYWHDFPSRIQDEHLRQLVDALFSALCHVQGRRWNPWAERLVRAEIKGRLKLACAGRLRPVDHVKSLRNGIADLFEIRWQDIEVYDELGGKKRHYLTNLRLIHAEPTGIPRAAIGLEALEKPKDSTGPGIHEEAIVRAEDYYIRHRTRTWGICLPGC